MKGCEVRDNDRRSGSCVVVPSDREIGLPGGPPSQDGLNVRISWCIKRVDHQKTLRRQREVSEICEVRCVSMEIEFEVTD
jgi:hypothetical protein